MKLGAKIAEIDSAEENNFLKEIAMNLSWSEGTWIVHSISWKNIINQLLNVCEILDEAEVRVGTLLINHVPTRIYMQYTAKNDNLFLMSVFVANYGNNITLHFHFCDDLESRFD